MGLVISKCEPTARSSYDDDDDDDISENHWLSGIWKNLAGPV